MAIHIMTRTMADGTRARVMSDMSDAEFNEAFSGIIIPPKWKITHLEESELKNGSPRLEVMKKMPCIFDTFTGSWLTKKDAIKMIIDDCEEWKKEQEEKMFKAAFSDPFDGLFDVSQED